MNSRYLLFEAQQAYHYGLDPALALASVTSVPASAAGLGHRIGTLAEGYDAGMLNFTRTLVPNSQFPRYYQISSFGTRIRSA